LDVRPDHQRKKSSKGSGTGLTITIEGVKPQHSAHPQQQYLQALQEAHSALDPAVLERLYSNTLGAADGTAAHLARLEAHDAALSSRSLLVTPSEGVSHAQPLNELFSDITRDNNSAPTPVLSPQAAAVASQLFASSASPATAGPISSAAATVDGFALPPAAGDFRTTSTGSSNSIASAASASASPNTAPAAAFGAAAAAAEPDYGFGSSLAAGGPGEAMLLMSDSGFGIVETGGVVLFVSSDLKTCTTRASKVFGSPAFTPDRLTAATSASGSTRGSNGSARALSPHPSASSASSASSSSTVPPLSPLSPSQRGKFHIGAIELWSFATPGSDSIAELSPRVRREAGSARPDGEQDDGFGANHGRAAATVEAPKTAF
jgi:hypothetical protein